MEKRHSGVPPLFLVLSCAEKNGPGSEGSAPENWTHLRLPKAAFPLLQDNTKILLALSLFEAAVVCMTHP